MATLQRLVVSLIVVMTIETFYTNSSAIGTNKLEILHNGAGSLTVKVDDRWARNHQPYGGCGTVIANGAKGDAGVCVVGVNPLDRQKDWTTSCVFTAAPNVDRSFNAMLTIGRANEAAFDAETFHYIGLHCYLDRDGYPQGWIHTQQSTEPVPTMTFEPEVKAAYNGKDSFAFQFSAAKQDSVSPQILTVIFSNGSAESRCMLDAKTIRPAPYRPWFVAYGTPNLFYCGAPQWTIHSVDFDADPFIPEPTTLANPPSIVPMPKETRWAEPTSWFTLDYEVAVDAGKQAENPAADSLRRQIMERCGVVPKAQGGRAIAVGERGKGNARLDRFCLEEGISPPANREGYTVVVQPDFVAVVGSSPAGTYYGVQTLVQMAMEDVDTGWRIPCGIVTDWPDFPFRGVYIQHSDMREVRAFSEKKINAVVFEGFLNIFDPDSPDAARQLFDECRQYGIEPIPMIQGFGHGDEIIRHNPNWAEGIYVRNEKLGFAEGTNPPPVLLAQPNVIRTEHTDILITDEHGKGYEEGTDYNVIPGDINPYQSPGKPFAIERLASGKIPDGGAVFASYDYAPLRAKSRYDLSFCPSEPATYEWLRELVESAVRELKPHYVMIGRDEPMRMSTDSRCLASGKTYAELFAWDVQRMVQFAMAVDPTVEVLMWADAVNPYRNAFSHTNNPTGPAIDLLPRQVILMPWFYGNFERLTMANSVEFFHRHGFRTIGGASRHVINPRHWAEVAWEYRGQELGMQGLLLTPWENPQGDYSLFANYAWTHIESQR
jgi:hypothetical protein